MLCTEEKCDVTLPQLTMVASIMDLNNFSRKRWPFDCRTMEEKHGLSSFAPDCNHAYESHSNYSNQVRYLLQHGL